MGLFDTDNDTDDTDDTPWDSDGIAPTHAGADILPPRANPNLVAHAKIEKSLLDWWKNANIPHAIVLAGPPGIGKATLAYRLARFLMANPSFEGDGLFGGTPTPDTLAVPTDHPVFGKIAGGSHPDLMSVERGINDKTKQLRDNILVDDVRELPNFLRKTAAEGGWRIVVLDEAETLNRNAQNALLKILEEPPSQSLLLIITQSVGALIPTIRSRARVMQVQTPDTDAFNTLVKSWHPSFSADDLAFLAKLSNCAPGQAVKLLDQGGLEEIKSIFDMLESLPSATDAQLWTLAETLAVKSTPDPLSGMLDIARWVLQANAKGCAATGANARLITALETFDALERHRNLCENGNLDRRQMAHGALRILQKGLPA